jgi:UDP-2-acetamido-3-amino-2,3-dideoxy-glucuronate N-acetyltransferase
VFVGPGAIFCNDLWPSVDKRGFSLGEGWTVVVEDGASIGAGAILLPGAKVGTDAMVAAGAVYGGYVPSGTVLLRSGGMQPMPVDGVSRRMRWAAAS